MTKWFLRFANGLITFAVVLALATAMLYAGYALWDNRQVYAAAENVLYDLNPRMAETEDWYEENGSAYAEVFEKLQAVNPDIGAWITVPNTGIDYPVVQGSNNIEYISTDPYGSFAIVGSIFLDFRNDKEYHDTYCLLYGHNMSENRMFSDINLYKDETFFNENQTGTLYLPTSTHQIQTLSIVLTNASDSWAFNPTPWNMIESEDIPNRVRQNAVYVSEAGMEMLQAKIDAGKRPRILALSTCSNEFTDARTILLTLMDPETETEPEPAEER